MDYDLHFHFATDYEFKTEASYRTVLSEMKKWRSVRIAPSLAWSAVSFMDLSLEVSTIYTVQTDTLNSIEVRIRPAAKFNITANKRIETRAELKFESRYLNNQSSSQWQKSNRLRLKGLMLVAINGKNHYQDKLWYAILDGEVFYVVDEDVSERFANRLRIGAGVGFRFNYHFRFEALYLGQQSRNALDETEFVTDDSIFRFKVKHYINRVKAAGTKASP